MVTLGSELKKLRSLIAHIERKTKKRVDATEAKEEIENYIFKIELQYRKELDEARTKKENNGETTSTN